MVLPAAWTPAIAQNALPALGDAESADFTVGTERKIGDEIMREIRVDSDYIDDPLLLEYLQSIWQPLVVTSRKLGNITPDIDRRFAWEPFLVRDASVNAFALPGGYIGVHLGMIALTASPDELASVLAHEISHISQRHIARSIAGNTRRSLVGLAALVIGLIAASRSNNPDAMNAVVVGSQAATVQGQLNFSRDVEREADRVGFQVMSAAGFAPGGMAAMFEKLDVSTRLNDFGGFPYLRSHPVTVERIGEARSRSGIAPGPLKVSALEHTVAQSRARVLMDPRVDALHRWQGQDASLQTSFADKLLAASESAQASSLLRDWSRADASFAKALALVRGSPASQDRAERALVLMQVQSLLARGEPGRAAEAMKRYAGDGSRPVLLLASQIALASASEPAGGAALRQSAADLQTRVALQPDDALAWVTLGQTWARLDRPLRSLRAEAESRYALGDLLGAADRLRAAQRVAQGGGPVDFIDASVVDSRLRDIEAQRRQIEKDRSGSR